MKQMLRKREVIDQVNVPKSTVTDWIIEFHMFIPTTKEGSVTYYRPDCIPVLLEIKRLREENYSKPDILRELKTRFPITVEGSAAEEIRMTLDNEKDPPSTVQSLDPEIVERMKMAVRFVGQHSELLQQHHVRLNNQEQNITDHESNIQELQKQLEEIKAELASTQELLLRKKKRWWQRRS